MAVYNVIYSENKKVNHIRIKAPFKFIAVAYFKKNFKKATLKFISKCS